jgi:hypothetical protein
MNVIKHTKYIWELEDFVPHSEIDYFLGMFEFYNPDLKEQFRNTSRENDTYIATDHPEMDEMAWKWVNRANQYYVRENRFIYYNWEKDQMVSGNSDDDSTVWRGQNVIRIYNESDSYDWHGDQSPANHAEFSYIIYLNDDFDGGDTRFMNDKLSVTPKKGTVLCFPVDHYHIHKGVKVTGGVKKILWNCVYRHEIQMMAKQPFLTAVDVPRSSKRCIW